MSQKHRRHTGVEDVVVREERAELSQQGLVRRTQSEMMPSNGSFSAGNHHDETKALVQGLYQGGMHSSAEASHTSNIAGIGNMQSSSIISKQVYRPTVVHKTHDNQDHSSTITKHKSKTRSTTRNQVVLNVQNLYLQSQSTSGTSVMSGISSLEQLFSPEVMSVGNLVLQNAPAIQSTLKAIRPAVCDSSSFPQGHSGRRSSKSQNDVKCRLQMMQIISREEPLVLNMVLVEGVVIVGDVIAVVKDSSYNKVGIIESLKMDGRFYQELNKLSGISSNGIDVKFQATPGRRTALYMKDFLPGDEFQCFTKGSFPTQQWNEATDLNNDATSHRSIADIQAGHSKMHQSRTKRSQQYDEPIPIMSNERKVVVPLRSAESASGYQPPRSNRGHFRREELQHDSPSISIASNETLVEAPITITGTPSNSAISRPKSKRPPSGRSMRAIEREIVDSRGSLDTYPPSQNSLHPSSCSLEVCAILRQDPLVLGVRLVDGIVMEDMQLYLAPWSTLPSVVVGTIVSLQIKQKAHQVIERTTPDVLCGIGMGVQRNQSNSSPSFLGTNIFVGNVLFGYQTDSSNTGQASLPTITHQRALDGVPEDLSMPAVQCSIKVFKVFKTSPLILGVLLVSGRLVRGTTVAKFQGTSGQPFSIIGVIESLEIQRRSYNVVDQNTPGLAEGIGVGLIPTGNWEDAVATEDFSLLDSCQLYCLDHTSIVTSPRVSRTPAVATKIDHHQHPKRVCSARITCIFKKEPLVLGVNLLSGELHVGMVVTTAGRNSSHRRLGKILSLEINRCSHKSIDQHTPGIQTGIGMMIESSNVNTLLIFGQDYTTGSALQCFMEDHPSTTQPPAVSNSSHALKPTAAGRSCLLRVHTCLKERPLVIGVSLLEGTLRLRTPLWLIKSQTSGGQPVLEWIGFINSMQINRETYEVIEKVGDKVIGLAIEHSNTPIPSFAPGDQVLGGFTS